MSRVAVYGYAGSVGFVRGVLLFAAAFALRLVRHLLFGIGLTAIGLILLKPAAAAPDSPDAGSRAISTDCSHSYQDRVAAGISNDIVSDR